MFEYTFNDECNLLIWKPTVQIDIDLAIEVARSISEIESQRPPFNRFIDLTNTSGISLHVTEMEKLRNCDKPILGQR
jgi:hypothetical protein